MAKIVPAANQIENHPYLPQQEIVDFCKAKGIHITAYSPLGSTGSPLFKEEGVQELAKKYNVGPGNILLSYHGEFDPETQLLFPPMSPGKLTVLSQSRVEAPSSPSPSPPPG